MNSLWFDELDRFMFAAFFGLEFLLGVLRQRVTVQGCIGFYLNQLAIYGHDVCVLSEYSHGSPG